MKKNYSIFSSCVLLLALALSLSSCSSSQTGDSEFGDDIPADAGTDAVPSEHAENAAPADGAQKDPNQAQQAQAANGDQQQQQQQQPQQPADQPPQEQVASADPQAQPSVTPDANTLASSTPPPAQPEPVTPAPIADPSTSAPSSSLSSTSPSSSGGSESYHVRHGDTLMRIAFEKYGDLYKWKQIYEANRDKIKDPNVIMPGTVLSLENVNNDLPARTGKRYIIKQGDTLARISNDVYGTPSKWKKIWEHNKPWIPNPNRIFAGFYLYYTGGKNPEDIERHEEENPVAPVAQDGGVDQEAPREPASQASGDAMPVPPAAR